MGLDTPLLVGVVYPFARGSNMAGSLSKPLFGKFPTPGTLIGFAMVCGFGWLFLDSTLDFIFLPSTPSSSNVERALENAGQRGAWVTLSDAKINCDAVVRTSDYGSYAPASDTKGRHHFVLKIESDCFCEESGQQPSGIFGGVSDRFFRSLKYGVARRGGHEGWENIPDSGALILRPYLGDSWVGMMFGFLLSLLGVTVLLYFRKPREEVAREKEYIPEQSNEIKTEDLEDGPILPSGPLVIQKDFIFKTQIGSGSAIAGGVVVAIGSLLWSIPDGVTLIQDRNIWNTGVTAAETEITGRQESDSFISSYTLGVRFVDQTENVHSDSTSFTSFLQPLPENTPLSVRFDPDHPSRFVVSWAMRVQQGRWLWVILRLLIGCIAGASLIYYGRKFRKTIATALKAANDHEEIELEVLSYEPMYLKGELSAWDCRYRIPGDSAVHKMTFGRRSPGPIFTDEEEKHILAFRSKSDTSTVTIVRTDFSPLVLTEGQKKLIEKKLAVRTSSN